MDGIIEHYPSPGGISVIDVLHLQSRQINYLESIVNTHKILIRIMIGIRIRIEN